MGIACDSENVSLNLIECFITLKCNKNKANKREFCNKMMMMQY